MTCIVLSSESYLRLATYGHIQAGYALNCDARVAYFPKTAIVLAGDKDKIHSAGGFMDSSEPYVSEHYLDAPVDAIASRVPTPEIWGTYYDTEPKVLAFGREQLTFLIKKAAPVAAREVHAHG